MTGRGGAAAVVADSGPVVVLAGIAAAGSFTHIRDTATGHGQDGWMAWAIAVCIDLTCVMAARERQRDKRTGRGGSAVSWPTVVLVGGILLSLAANLAQAERSIWGWVVAGTPAAAFLVAVSMLERRSAAPSAVRSAEPVRDIVGSAPASLGVPSPSPSSSLPSSSSSPAVPGPVPVSVPAAVPVAELDHNQVPELLPASTGEQTQIPVPASSPVSAAGRLVEIARRVAEEHQTAHGRPITRDALRSRLGVSNQLASDLLRQLRTTA